MLHKALGSTGWLLLPGGILGILFLAPLQSTHRAFGLQMLGLLLAGLTLASGWARARREPSAKSLGLLLAGFGGLAMLYRLELLQRLFALGTGMAVHPLRDALLWLLAIALLLLSLVTLNRAEAGAGRPWARVLDGLIFSISFYLLLWMGLVRPWLAASSIPLAFSLSSQALFALTAAGLGVALHTLIRQGSLKGPAAPLAASLAVFAVVFPWSLAASFHQSYPLDHPARFLAILAFVFVLQAVQTPLAPPREGPLGRWMDLLPYGPAALAFLGFLAGSLLGAIPRDPLAPALLSLLAVFVLARQGLTLMEVAELNRTLEHKVEARTRELADREALILRTQGMNLVATLGAGMAHDLNNLIGGAVMLTDLLSQEEGHGNPRLDKDLGSLKKTLGRAGELTQRLMSVGRVHPTEGHVEIGAHLRGMTPMLRALVPKTMGFSCELEPGPFAVSCAPSQLDQIVVNLVVNARDALKPGGRIHVTLRPGAPQVPGESAGVALTVEDSGTGIPNTVLHRIFEPFFSTKPVGQGTGLGLGSVKSVVEALGGDIQLRTKEGQGTCFTIWLPLAAASPSPMAL